VLGNLEPWSEVARRIGGRAGAELVASASALGLACARVGELAPQAAVLRLQLGSAPARDLQGVRVVNLASLWAGPLAALVLTRLGADVVCVESLGRPDGARATPHWFDAMHTGQRSVALDFGRDEDIATLVALLGAADVVIEGSRPRALAQLGISAIELARTGPRVWVSITGHGRAPQYAMRVALGDDAAAAGGLVGWIDEGPVFIADAVADPLTGLVAANAVVDAVSNGGRWLLDVALARVASAVAPRGDDPVVHVLPDASPGRTVPPGSPSFELGADTDRVLDEWLGR
jgi:crotonobetainyl-CoA:carnitine CoA-transferase CaiB-like acyl-CoA transferase